MIQENGAPNLRYPCLEDTSSNVFRGLSLTKANGQIWSACRSSLSAQHIQGVQSLYTSCLLPLIHSKYQIGPQHQTTLLAGIVFREGLTFEVGGEKLLGESKQSSKHDTIEDMATQELLDSFSGARRYGPNGAPIHRAIPNINAAKKYANAAASSRGGPWTNYGICCLPAAA
jgi:hypothetical protein